jgi:hypothetical protein
MVLVFSKVSQYDPNQKKKKSKAKLLKSGANFKTEMCIIYSS